VLFPCLLFFALSLAGLALTSLRRARLMTSLHTSATLFRLTLTRPWALSALLVILGIVGGGLMVAVGLSPEAWRVLAQSMAVLLTIVTIIFGALIAPLVMVMAFVLALIGPWLGRWLRNMAEAFSQILNRLSGLFGAALTAMWWPIQKIFDTTGLTEFFESPAGEATGRAGLVLLAVVGMAVLFWVAVQRAGWLNNTSPDEQRESILSRALLFAQLRALWRNRAPAPLPAAFLPLTDRDDPARRVRLAYRDLLRWALAQGQPRPPGRTPSRYGEFLAQTQSARGPLVRQLTALYLRARYAIAHDPQPLTVADAQSAQSAAEQLLATLTPEQRKALPPNEPTCPPPAPVLEFH
jgi:hypothetical protein